MLDCIDDQTSQHELFCSRFSNCVILPGRNHCPWLRSVTDGLRTHGKQKKVEKQTFGMQSECVHVPTASTITVKMKKKKSVVMGDWPREHCKFNRCIIDQDHIFSLRKKPYRSLKKLVEGEIPHLLRNEQKRSHVEMANVMKNCDPFFIIRKNYKAGDQSMVEYIHVYC